MYGTRGRTCKQATAMPARSSHTVPLCACSGLTQEEKTYLRGRFSCLIPQDDNQIAVQVALVYAKVARSDYPREWPSLFHDLLANLDTAGKPQWKCRVG